jgi:hypothetical protein
MTKLYAKIRRIADRMEESNDCGIIAVAAITGLTYKRVHKEFERVGRKHRRGVNIVQILDVLRCLSVKVEERMFPPRTINQCERKLCKRSRWLIITRSHAVAMTGGEVHDWTKGRKHRPVIIFRCNRIGKAKR